MARNHVFTALLLVGVVLCVLTALPFVPALLWAATLAILAKPLADRFKRLGPTGAALLATLVTGLILVVPLVLIGVGLGLQVGDVSERLQGRSLESLTADLEKALAPLTERVGIEHFDLRKTLQDNGSQIAGAVRPAATKFAVGAATTVVTLVVALLTQFFLLRDGDRLREPAFAFSPLSRAKTEALMDRTAETVRAVFVGTVLVAALQGAIMGGAYWAAGIPNALLLAVVSAVLCVIPLLGAPVLYIPLGLGLLATGNARGAAIVLGVGFLIVSQVDNVMKPFLISGRASLHPMAIFFAILGGTLLVGPIGVMAGPMLLTIVLGLLEALRQRMEEETSVTSPAPLL